MPSRMSFGFGDFDAVRDFEDSKNGMGLQEQAFEMLHEEEERVEDEQVAYDIEEQEACGDEI